MIFADDNKRLIKWAEQNMRQRAPISAADLEHLQRLLSVWAGSFYQGIAPVGATAKNTMTPFGAQAEFIVSLKSGFSGEQKNDQRGLINYLKKHYPMVKAQGVSVRIMIPAAMKEKSVDIRTTGKSRQADDVVVDIIPGRVAKEGGHWIWVAAQSTWVRADLNHHSEDIAQAGFANEIKLFKMWRDSRKLIFPTLYLEYLLITQLLSANQNRSAIKKVWQALSVLAYDETNLLNSPLFDPWNENNDLSCLITDKMKAKIQVAARKTLESGVLVDIKLREEWG